LFEDPLRMLKPAFSTVACPEWTLRTVADRAVELGFEAVELRTFGDGSRQFACDPALSSDSKVRGMFMQRGIEILSLGSSVRFDEPIFPPVLGHFLHARERSVREGKRAVDLAVGLECPLVRVFGFEYPAREGRNAALGRIAGRLSMVLDHADKSGVRIVLENGGSFSTSQQMLELMDKVNHPLLGACYGLGAGVVAGEDPAAAVRSLGARLWAARVTDIKDGRPCELGMGELPAEAWVRALIASGFDGPLVYAMDRAWTPDAAATPPDGLLRAASKAIYGWLGATETGGAGTRAIGGAAAARPAR